MNDTNTLYFGFKSIHAVPMNRREYNDYRGWEMPSDENGDDPGFLIEDADGGPTNDPRHAGYISWSPAEVFGRSYRCSGSMTFGMAIEAMKQGWSVQRSGWNGKGMWVTISGVPNRTKSVPSDGFSSAHNAAYADENGGAANVLPCFTMKTATGEILMGWLASQTDMLAEDWALVKYLGHEPMPDDMPMLKQDVLPMTEQVGCKSLEQSYRELSLDYAIKTCSFGANSRASRELVLLAALAFYNYLMNGTVTEDRG